MPLLKSKWDKRILSKLNKRDKNYCIYLGKHIDPKTNKHYDLGIHITYDKDNKNRNTYKLKPEIVKIEDICYGIICNETNKLTYRTLYNKDGLDFPFEQYKTESEAESDRVVDELIKRVVEKEYILRCERSFTEPYGFKSNPERIKNYFIN